MAAGTSISLLFREGREKRRRRLLFPALRSGNKRGGLLLLPPSPGPERHFFLPFGIFLARLPPTHFLWRRRRRGETRNWRGSSLGIADGRKTVAVLMERIPNTFDTNTNNLTGHLKIDIVSGQKKPGISSHYSKEFRSFEPTVLHCPPFFLANRRVPGGIPVKAALALHSEGYSPKETPPPRPTDLCLSVSEVMCTILLVQFSGMPAPSSSSASSQRKGKGTNTEL